MDPPLWSLLGHSSACYGLTQPFEQALKTRQVLAKLRLAVLHGSEPITQARLHPGYVLAQPSEQPD